MNLPYDDRLNIGCLQRLFDNMSESYKLFWFQGIVDIVHTGKTRITFDEIINNMIADAWYMVTEYRLNLGPADTLEALVKYAGEITGIRSNEKRQTIIEAISSSDNREFRKKKNTLSLHVPYRLQAPFLHDFTGASWKVGRAILSEDINRHNGLIYRFEIVDGLKSTLIINEKWAEYISNNYEIVSGWIQFNLIQYLQKRNPSVPGIPNKIHAPAERKLEKVKKFWNMVSEVTRIKDIYGNETVSSGNISIDHFVPWSYVAHDEMWNLHPTTKRINSSKSNNLPEWDGYFSKLCDIEYKAYRTAWENEKILRQWNICLKDHVNSDSVRFSLFREGLSFSEYASTLENVLLPVYTSAKNLGFNIWKYE